MCVNFDPPARHQLPEYFGTEPPGAEWRQEVWQDYAAPIIVERKGTRIALTATYGLVPKDKWPPGVRLTTMNARAETVGEKRTYKRPWSHSQFCLIPMTGYYEPNYESGKPVRWRIYLKDEQPFAVAGLWQLWDADTDQPRYAFTQLTVNADEHPFMQRFHKPGDERRSLVVVAPADYDAWLNCRNPEIARTFLQLYPAELMMGEPKPVPPRTLKVKPQQSLLE